MDGLACVIISMHYAPAKLYNRRKKISHDVEMNNKGILHLFGHSVRDVELEEKDTEGGDKDKVQLNDLTDIVIVWLT